MHARKLPSLISLIHVVLQYYHASCIYQTEKEPVIIVLCQRWQNLLLFTCLVRRVCTEERSRPQSSERTWFSLSAIQLSTTSVFQINCRKAELSIKPALRRAAASSRADNLSWSPWIRWEILSLLWLPYEDRKQLQLNTQDQKQAFIYHKPTILSDQRF